MLIINEQNHLPNQNKLLSLQWGKSRVSYPTSLLIIFGRYFAVTAFFVSALL